MEECINWNVRKRKKNIDEISEVFENEVKLKDCIKN
jgi:hypothetical protein